ncbi:hypothetical protein ACLOJK_023418 [Asimina triloba]
MYKPLTSTFNTLQSVFQLWPPLDLKSKILNRMIKEIKINAFTLYKIPLCEVFKEGEFVLILTVEEEKVHWLVVPPPLPFLSLGRRPS